MNINKTVAIYFSPTGTTKSILEGITQGLDVRTIERVDLTRPAEKEYGIVTRRDDLAVIGTPVYFGRVPPIAVQRFKAISAEKTPAVIVVGYGNRAYEDALLELSEIAKTAGLVPIAAAAFVGEHSFSTEATPIAVGRPDAQDLMLAKGFGTAVMKKIREIQNIEMVPALPLPGNTKYKDTKPWSDITPATVSDLCNLCGDCAAVCPTAAIIIDTSVETDKTKCITCCACVKSCPLEARFMAEPLIKQISEWLSTSFQEKKAPETFI